MQHFRQHLTPSDPQIVSGVALQSPLGMALRDALDSLVKEDAKKDDESEESVHTDNTCEIGHGGMKDGGGLKFQTDISDSIINGYREAVVRTDFSNAPAVILSGRMDHYNRVDHRWRIAVEDAELRPRAKDTRLKRRRETRVSLWGASETEHPGAKRLKVDGTLHILAYGDASAREE